MGHAAGILGSALAVAAKGPTAIEGLVATEPAEGPVAAGPAEGPVAEGPTAGGVGPWHTRSLKE